MSAEIWLICSRSAWDSHQRLHPLPGDVWVGAGVLSESQQEHLRSLGWRLSVFVDELNPSDRDDIADRVDTVLEHHPGSIVRVA